MEKHLHRFQKWLKEKKTLTAECKQTKIKALEKLKVKAFKGGDIEKVVEISEEIETLSTKETNPYAWIEFRLTKALSYTDYDYAW